MKLRRRHTNPAHASPSTFHPPHLLPVPFVRPAPPLQPEGVGRIHPIGAMSDFEKANFDKMVPELKSSIEKGIKFAQAWAPK